MIRLDGVRKRYRRGPDVLLAADVSIERGRPLVVRGANGSGKSTLLRIVAGCERPTAGRVRGRPAVVGYVPDRFPASTRMPASAYLRHFAAISRAPDAAASARAALLDRLAFTGNPGAPMSRLSKGNAQKVALTHALTCGAGLLVLDEPWSGLDAAAGAALTAELAAAVARDVLIVVADHGGRSAALTGADRRVLRDGALVPDDEPLPAPAAVVTIEVDCAGDPAVVLAALPPVLTSRVVGGGVEVGLAAADGDVWLAAALAGGCSVRSVRRSAS